MAEKIPPPPKSDLCLDTRTLISAYGVSESTVHRWKAKAGLTRRRGSPEGVKAESIQTWMALSKDDWNKGHAHVGRLMGITRQAAYQMKKRLVRDGHLPALKDDESPGSRLAEPSILHRY